MNLHPKISRVALAILTLIAFSCTEPVDWLAEAQRKLAASPSISYTETALYPIPESDLVDTVIAQIEYLVQAEDSLGYQFIQKTRGEVQFYQAEVLQVTKHSDKLVRTYTPEHFDSREGFFQTVKGNFRSRWSPMTLLGLDWEFVGDTIMDQTRLKHYSRVESDREYEGRKIHTENHIFIHADAWMERFERKNFIDGTLSQKITIHYSDYNQTHDALHYDIPADYTSAYGKAKPMENLKVGDPAPAFHAVNMEGDSVNLEMFSGGKVLLNFSVIACGNCKKTLNHFTQEGYVLSEEIPILYLNPEDNSERLVTYMEKTAIPFPVIPDAQEIAQQYAVNSYPRFFLIDEQGMIENIQIGYSKEFIDEFRQ
ncbi:redoxin domain-containing protein [Pontibacter sp. G13]|uniref:TlpA family protein disulfide reductase n=1 Tax=Pontibacter sp. G13 TaxID=3074898 RepID=UPI00288A314D|nr:redoxin domain-containing protein [Pontibacter sp. G13]WNJ17638.1 redoxin domain-containing protein [Pontibacter sp. G13]